MSESRILFLSIAVESVEFDCYDMRSLTTCESTDLTFWLDVHRVSRDFFEYVNASNGGPYPAAGEFRGVIVGGSMYSSYENRPWQIELKAYLRDAIGQEIPVLGVCGGHQLLVEALGGVVAANARGRHVGAFPLHLTPEGAADPFMQGIADGALVQCVHGDVAVSLPRGAIALAATGHDTNEVVRFGPRAVSTQFHLEFSREGVAHLIRHYEEHAGDVTIGAEADAAPVQRRLFANWLAQLV